jgi:protein-disulfide isomerase
MSVNKNISKKHFVIGGLIIALALTLQPFASLMVQNTLAPLIAPRLMGSADDAGSTDMAGREISTENLKVQGASTAKIFLVEFSDYECPFCARFHNTPKQILSESDGKVAWAWKHFPLTQIHQNARPAAVAAECVAKLGGVEKFWQFSDVLIANQRNLNESLYKVESAKLGINANAFNSCLKDVAMGTIVDKNLSEGETLGVTGTPSTFVVKNDNGKLIILENINGALPKETVDSIIKKYSE